VNRRPLKTIAAELATVLRRETKSVIEAGGLLAEAREQLDENEQWLLWLRDNFSLSIRTAQRYLAAHAFAGAYDTVSHVSLTVSGLYALIEADQAGHSEAVEAALSEAKDKRIDDTRVWEIVAALRPPPTPPPDEGSDDGEPPPDEAEGADLSPDEADAEDTEPNAEGSDEAPEPPPPDDDRPPPTPPPGLNPRQAAQLRQFEEAAKALLGIAAKPSREFVTTDMAGFDLETIADFLRQIAKEKSKAGEAADQPQAIH
jgi:hypothetical protein